MSIEDVLANKRKMASAMNSASKSLKIPFKLRQIISLQKALKQKPGPDSYDMGVYNGLELAMQIISNKDPVFWELNNEEG